MSKYIGVFIGDEKFQFPTSRGATVRSRTGRTLEHHAMNGGMTFSEAAASLTDQPVRAFDTMAEESVESIVRRSIHRYHQWDRMQEAQT